MQERSAVIIVGNPKFVRGNAEAERFYTEVKEFLESLGYSVSFDSGEEYTEPPKADLWIGHSRGGDRLRFAPPETKTLVFGSSAQGAINDPRDNTIRSAGPSDIVPNAFHYAFTEEMKDAIRKLG